MNLQKQRKSFAVCVREKADKILKAERLLEMYTCWQLKNYVFYRLENCFYERNLINGGMTMRLNRKISTVVFAVLMLLTVIGVNKKVSHAEDFSDAITIQVNQPVGDFLEKGYDYQQNYYKFTVYEPGSVKIKFFNPLQSNSDQYWSVYLYDSEYKELCWTRIYGNKTSTESLTTGIPMGTYYIKVNSANWQRAATDMYTLEAEFAASDMWEKEFNEEFITATNIEVNAEYSGSIRSGYDYEKDYYKFQVKESGYITVNFTNPLQGDSDGYWNVYLYNSEYKELCSKTIFGNKTSTNLTETGVDSGTYYIKVQSTSWNGASVDIYTVKAAYTPSLVWERELNEDFVNATNIDLETEYYGTTWAGYDYEKDFYKFTIPKTGLYSIEVSTPSLNNTGEYWKLYLYNETYEELESKSIHGNKTFHAISRTLSSGTYYVRISSPSWSQAASTERYVLKVTPTTAAGVQATCEHNYGSYYVDATYFSKGYRVYTCEKCGYSYKGDYSDKKLLEQGYLYSYCSTGKGKLYLSWSTVSDATGYQIRYSTDKSFKTGVVVKNVNGQSVNSKTISKLLRKKKYYVQIRPYVKNAGKKAYGKWSAKMALKTK